MKYLDLWVARDGFRPINNMIEEITNIKPPPYRKEVQKFLDVMNYYRNMWPWWSQTLEPLTKFM